VAVIQVPTGTYAINGDKDACFADSTALDADGNLDVDDSVATKLTLFICE
jgi:hypothetical protein